MWDKQDYNGYFAATWSIMHSRKSIYFHQWYFCVIVTYNTVIAATIGAMKAARTDVIGLVIILITVEYYIKTWNLSCNGLSSI